MAMSSVTSTKGHLLQFSRLEERFRQGGVQGMARPQADHVGSDRRKQDQVAEEVQELMPGHLVGEAEGADVALLADDHRALQASAAGQPLGAHPLDCRQKADGPSRRQVPAEVVPAGGKLGELHPDRRVGMGEDVGEAGLLGRERHQGGVPAAYADRAVERQQGNLSARPDQARFRQEIGKGRRTSVARRDLRAVQAKQGVRHAQAPQGSQQMLHRRGRGSPFSLEGGTEGRPTHRRRVHRDLRFPRQVHPDELKARPGRRRRHFQADRLSAVQADPAEPGRTD
jgi:hypothetical protein